MAGFCNSRGHTPFRQNAFPDKPTARFKLLCAHHISGETLYKNKDLWHPAHVNEQQRQLIEAAVEVSALHLAEREAACAGGAAASLGGTSLLDSSARNVLPSQASSTPVDPESEQKPVSVRNVPTDKASGPVETEPSEPEVEGTPPPKQLALNIQWALQVARSKQRAQAEENKRQYQQAKRQRSQAEYMAQLHQWMNSGDLVLVAEAERILEKMARASGSD